MIPNQTIIISLPYQHFLWSSLFLQVISQSFLQFRLNPGHVLVPELTFRPHFDAVPVNQHFHLCESVLPVLRD